MAHDISLILLFEFNIAVQKVYDLKYAQLIVAGISMFYILSQ